MWDETKLDEEVKWSEVRKFRRQTARQAGRNARRLTGRQARRYKKRGGVANISEEI